MMFFADQSLFWDKTVLYRRYGARNSRKKVKKYFNCLESGRNSDTPPPTLRVVPLSRGDEKRGASRPDCFGSSDAGFGDAKHPAHPLLRGVPRRMRGAGCVEFRKKLNVVTPAYSRVFSHFLAASLTVPFITTGTTRKEFLPRRHEG